MTIDARLKSEGAPERSPIAGAGTPSGVDAGAKRYSVQRKMAVVARLLRGEPLDVVAREANVSVAKLTEWRDRALAGAASALKERERDDREDEIARLKSKLGEITMDNECCPSRSPPWRQKALWPEGGRDDEPDGLAFHVSFLWPGAGLARVEYFARQRVSFSQRNAIACDRPSPRSDRRLSGC
jgi:Transposase